MNKLTDEFQLFPVTDVAPVEPALSQPDAGDRKIEETQNSHENQQRPPNLGLVGITLWVSIRIYKSLDCYPPHTQSLDLKPFEVLFPVRVPSIRFETCRDGFQGVTFQIEWTLF